MTMLHTAAEYKHPLTWLVIEKYDQLIAPMISLSVYQYNDIILI